MYCGTDPRTWWRELDLNQHSGPRKTWPGWGVPVALRDYADLSMNTAS